MKPSPARLRIETYPFTTLIEPRFGDVDALQHLNNVALAGIYEEGRIRFTNMFQGPFKRPETLEPPAGRRTVIAELAICYLAEGQYPGTLTVATGRVTRRTNVLCDRPGDLPGRELHRHGRYGRGVDVGGTALSAA